MAVNPQPGTHSIIVAGGTAVQAVPANPLGGGIITNPLAPGDQGIASVEPLYVSPMGNATLQAHDTTFALAPGQSWQIIPGQMTPTSVNAATDGHRFSVVWW